MQTARFYNKYGLKEHAIEELKKEIQLPANKYTFPDGNLKVLLSHPDKAELVCALYKMYKLYLQAIEEAGAEDADKVYEKQQVENCFLILFTGLFNLTPIKSSIFDCAMSINDSLHQSSSKFNCLLDNFSSQPTLNMIVTRKCKQTEQSYDAFVKRGEFILLLRCIFIIKPLWKIFFTSEPVAKWQVNLIAAVIIAFFALHNIAKRLYPEWDAITNFSPAFYGLIFRYLTNGALTTPPKLAEYKDYLYFFNQNPEAQPRTLYELAYKIMSKSDFYSEIPYPDFQDELTQFFNQNAKHIAINSNLFFPEKEFVTIMIGAPLPWVNFIEWPFTEAEKDKPKTYLATKAIQSVLKQYNFFQFSNSTETPIPNLAVKKAL